MGHQAPLTPLPSRIGRLHDLAQDLWWNWNHQACEVFLTLDDQLWDVTSHNPVLLLHLLKADRVTKAATDPAFLAQYDAAIESLNVGRSPIHTWWGRRVPAMSARVSA